MKWTYEIIFIKMFYLLIILLIITDLFTKYIASKNFLEIYFVFKDFIYLKYAENNWIAFSVQLTWLLLKIFTIIILIIIFWYYLKEEKKKNNIFIDLSFALILAWWISNWYERIFNNYVIDFIWVKYFAIFNFADIYISIWAMIYIFILFFVKDKKNEIRK